MIESTKITRRLINTDIEHRLIQAGKSPLMARIFAARGVNSEEEVDLQFALLPHFNLFKNMQEVTELLADAIIQQKKIVVVGDYDADGATSCAVAVKSIGAMGGVVDFIVPSREKDGYGLSTILVDRAQAKGAEIIITVDNGMSAIQSVPYAKSKGMTVIVTDHHLPGEEVPDCLIINPNQKDCAFPSGNLAGVGVIFYVMLGLRSKLEQLNYFDIHTKPNLSNLLDLVALGTVADVVPLDHTNRILINHGLKLIRLQRSCVGIQALFDVAKRLSYEAKTFDLGFALGPRINAAGRLDDISISVRCLLADTYEEAYQYALELNSLNQKRKKTEGEMLSLTEEELAFEFEHKPSSIVMFSDNFHQGVIGIVAGRLKEKYNRPTIVFAKGDNNEIKGSGRSIPGLHLRDILDSIAKQEPDLILKFGGHAMAAGLSIDVKNFDRFKQVFESTMHERELMDLQLFNKIYITDGELDVSDMNLQVAKELNHMIWGQGFEEPKFNNQFEVVEQKLVGSQQNHLKVTLKKDNQLFGAMIFNCQDILPYRVNLVYRLEANKWAQREELQLYVDYWEEVHL